MLDYSDFTHEDLLILPQSTSYQRGLSEFEVRGSFLAIRLFLQSPDKVIGGYFVAGAVSIPSIGNLRMEQLLTRIEFATAFGLWEVRLSCIEALSKIAFRSSLRVRLHILSFFQYLLTGMNSGPSLFVCVDLAR